MLAPHTKYFFSLIAKLIFLWKWFDLPKRYYNFRQGYLIDPYMSPYKIGQIPNHQLSPSAPHAYTPPPSYQFCHIDNGSLVQVSELLVIEKI